MAIETVTLKLSKNYTDESILGLGSIKGANCTIKSIEKVDATNKVTFAWIGSDGTERTSVLNVLDGVSIVDTVDNGNNTFSFRLSDGSLSSPIEKLKGDRGIDGEKGEKGEKGDAGEDGLSPTATVNKVGDTTTITITDINGTTTAEIKDGTNSNSGGVIVGTESDINDDTVIWIDESEGDDIVLDLESIVDTKLVPITEEIQDVKDTIDNLDLTSNELVVGTEADVTDDTILLIDESERDVTLDINAKITELANRITAIDEELRNIKAKL